MSPSACLGIGREGGAPALCVVVAQEVSSTLPLGIHQKKKQGAELECVSGAEKSEREAERAQHHFYILEGSNRSQCVFSFHELKYECLLQSLPTIR